MYAIRSYYDIIIGQGLARDNPSKNVAGGIEYFDSVTQTWEQADVLNIDLSSDYSLVDDQYIVWQIDTTRWGKFQILVV